MHDPRRGLQHSAAPGGGRGERTIALRGDPHADLRRAGDDHRPPGLPRWGAALACFVVLLAGGSLLLSMPGILKAGRISALDAVVLAASAVTLTGLSPVPVSELSQQGQVLLLVLFQGSGIAIIAFSILHLAVPGALHARSSQRIVRPRWIEVEQLRTGRLLRDIGEGKVLGDTSTLADVTTVEKLKLHGHRAAEVGRQTGTGLATGLGPQRLPASPAAGALLRPDWIAGIFMLMRRATFARLGGFDPRYRMYFEDVDLCTRARLMGLRILVDTDLRLQHDPRHASRRAGRHLLWHIQSGLRFFASDVYRRARRLSGNG